MSKERTRRRIQFLRLVLLLTIPRSTSSSSPPTNRRVPGRVNLVNSESSPYNATQVVGNHTAARRRRKRRKRIKTEGSVAASVDSGQITKQTSKRPETVLSSAGKTTPNAAAPIKEKVPDDEPHKRTTKTRESGGREATCLRRIKHEWRDAVKHGIAYDWIKMKPVKSPVSTLDKDKYAYVRIGPLGKNLLRWHFSVMGAPNSEYEGGIYHGRVLLPKDYPGSPPRIQVLTPSGRFIPGEDICLSASNFHPESWTPRWTVLSLVDALRLHMLTTANEIGGKDATPEERRQYARRSRQWRRGNIDHGRMVRDGLFPLKEEGGKETNRAEKTSDNVLLDHDTDGGVQVAVKQTLKARPRETVPQNAKLSSVLIKAVVEVLTSPRRLLVLVLLTVFVILNRR